jgi:putative polyhydroxyalkanoate system protein
MNTIQISHCHNDDKDSACDKAEQMLVDLANDYSLAIESDGDGYITFSGSGITGTVTIDHNEINISAKLGFLMIAMKQLISAQIENKLKQKFS